jgi:uncharacterized membrane protein
MKRLYVEESFRMNTKSVMNSALAGVLTLGMVAAAGSALAADNDKEKCYGVAKAGKNDCAAPGHSCAGHAVKDGDAASWVYLPKGTCEKLIGGSVSKPAG